MPGVRLAGRYVMARPPKYQPGEWARIRADTRAETDRLILQLAADGLTNKEIATQLVIGKRTVDTHVAHVLAKLGIRRRSEIAALIASRPE